MSPASEALVEVEGVWRRYRHSAPDQVSTLRQLISRGGRGFRRPWFWALRGVDLTVGRGQSVALIGRNGAGKSTLLRLIGGVGRADRGAVRTRGRIGALLDLGNEFHPDLTGYQNAEVAAVVAGLTRAEFRARLPAILEFAELEEFVGDPLRAYSDGMRARLAFSVGAHVDPEVLLIDEVLGVGDAPFQRRTVARIDELRHRGTAVVFVSHDLSLARRVCDTAVWLEEGEIRARGDASSVVKMYLDEVMGPASPAPAGSGSRLSSVRTTMLDAWEAPTDGIAVGEGLVLELEITPPGEQRCRLSTQITAHGSDTAAVDTSTEVSGSETLTYRVAFERLDLAPGSYDVFAALYSDDWSTVFATATTPLTVTGDGPDRAVLAPPHEWRRRKAPRPGSPGP